MRDVDVYDNIRYVECIQIGKSRKSGWLEEEDVWSCLLVRKDQYHDTYKYAKEELNAVAPRQFFMFGTTVSYLESWGERLLTFHYKDKPARCTFNNEPWPDMEFGIDRKTGHLTLPISKSDNIIVKGEHRGQLKCKTSHAN